MNFIQEEPKSQIPMNYGRAVRIARALAELEQKGLAKRAGLDASHISLIEQGKRNPTVATLEKIALALDMPYHILTLLASESKDLKNVSTREISELAERLARILLNEGRARVTPEKKSRPGGRSKT